MINEVINISLKATNERRKEEEERLDLIESKIKKSSSIPEVLRNLSRAKVKYRDYLQEIIKVSFKSDFFKNAEVYTEMNYVCYEKDNITVKFPTYLSTTIEVLVKVKVDKTWLYVSKRRTDYKALNVYDSYLKGEVDFRELKKTVFKKNNSLKALFASKSEVEEKILEIQKKKENAEKHNLEIEKAKKKHEINKDKEIEKAKEILKEDLEVFYENNWRLSFKPEKEYEN